MKIIFQMQADAEVDSNVSPMSNENKREQIVLFVKLFVIMGLSWFSEVLHIFLHGDHSHNEHCNFVVEVNGQSSLPLSLSRYQGQK
jgi:hypothetical protein